MEPMATEPGTGLATRARTGSIHGAGPRYTALDRLRARELTRRLKLGETPVNAWGTILTDADLGYPKLRGMASLPAGKIARTLEAFLRRAADEEMAAALDSCRLSAAHLAHGALQRVAAIVEGEFGRGRVVARGRGDDAYEEVEIDAPAASVQLKAARTLLEIVRVLPRSGSQTNVNVTQQTAVAVETDRHDARRLVQDPDIARQADALAACLEGEPGVDGGAPDARPGR